MIGLLGSGGAAALLLAIWAPISLWVLLGARRQSRVTADFTRKLDALQESQQTIRSILDTANDAFVGMDAAGIIDDWNDAAVRVFGWSRHEALGAPLAELIIPTDLRAAHNKGMKRYQQTGHGPMLGRTIEMTALRRDGTTFPVELTTWESWAQGERRFNAFIRDITERKRLENELTHRALHDSLTGLSNRTLFADRLTHALARRGHDHVGVLFLDLDDFKTVNDNLGHAAGDHLLVAVATRLSSVVRPGDTLARLAGDEFALLVEGITGLSDASDIARRLLDTLHAPFHVGGRETFVSASVGIAMHDSSDADLVSAHSEAMLRNADIAMYTAKSTRRSRYVVFEPEMHAAAVLRLELKADLQRALDRDELRVHYQPYVVLSTGAVVGFEAIVRWQHPERGLLEPSAIVAMADETGQLRDINRWVLGEATRQAAWWQSSRPSDTPLTMSVPISARDLQDPALVAEVAAVLESTCLVPSTLVIEVADGALTDDLDVVNRLAQLGELGVRIAVDDCADDHSSLVHLSRFPVDGIKIVKFEGPMPAAEAAGLLPPRHVSTRGPDRPATAAVT